jgi:nucleotidyltransferase substrate binding protein (TIGR01987 family)
MKEAKISVSFTNLDKAFASLKEFVADPIVTRRDQAGVIQAFEYTYEQFWKHFKKVAEGEKFEVHSPRQSIEKAFVLGIVQPEFEATWVDMIKTRNETSHTYNDDQAKSALKKILSQFIPAFENAVLQLEKYR